MTGTLTDFIKRVRKGKRGKTLEGTQVFNLDVVVCPTWEEKERLEGKGVLPIYVDELEAFANSKLLTHADKQLLMKLMLKVPGTRFERIEEEKWQRKTQSRS
jgi:hypothetical protein